METIVQVYSISADFIASQVTAIDIELFNDLKKNFKLRKKCPYVVCVGLDNKQNAHKYHYYEILDSNLTPINNLNGIYKLDNSKLVESWRGQWKNIFIPLYFHSDIYDRTSVPLTSSKDQIIKNVQQIAIVLEALDGRTQKITDLESAEIRNKINQYLGLRRI